MADGEIVIRTKDGVVVAAEREAAAGVGALIYAAEVFQFIDPFQTIELISFTLTERTTVYINSTISVQTPVRFYRYSFRIPDGIGSWQTEGDYTTSMSTISWTWQNRDNFDVVTLDAGTYTLYADLIINEGNYAQVQTQVIYGDNTEASTMSYQVET